MRDLLEASGQLKTGQPFAALAGKDILLPHLPAVLARREQMRQTGCTS